MLILCLSREISEVATVARSEKEIFLDGAAEEEEIKAENLGSGAEEKEGLPVTGEADTELQLPEKSQEGANGQKLERIFLNLKKKWDFQLIAAESAVNVVTGRESAKNVCQLWKF